MQALYLALSVLTSAYSGVSYCKLSQCSKNRAASFLMPVLWYLPLLVVFGVCAVVSGLYISSTMLLSALMAGVAYALCAFSLLESMKANSFSLTIIITNLSFIFPVVFSMIFLKESAGVLQLIGMLLAVAVIVLMNIDKRAGKSTLGAILLAVCSSLGNGVIDFAIKIQQHYEPDKSSYTIFFFSSLFGTVFCLLMYLFFRSGGQRAEFSREHRRELLFYAPAVAVCNGICFFAIGKLAGLMNAAAQCMDIVTEFPRMSIRRHLRILRL